jgi:hypothetical protein
VTTALRARHAQGIFDWIVRENERREHRAKVQELKDAADADAVAWRGAPTGTADEKTEQARLRGVWTTARDQYLAQRKNVQRGTGPATMLSIKATLSSALGDAVKEELIAENYAAFLTLPKVTKPRALAWTAPRVARWRRTGEKPSPVMVWTLQQAVLLRPLGPLVELSGLPPIRLHDGRHETASLALAVGVAPKAVQAMLGHSSMGMTTDTYQSVQPEMHAATASASLDLIAAFREQERKKAEKKPKKKPKKQARKVA